MPAFQTKIAIISISSHVMRGSVGNRASAFALETLGHPVWSVPTVLLPWHPGHGRSTRIAIDPDLFATALEDLSGARWREEVGAAMTGYFADKRQVSAAAALVRSFRERDPGFIYLCDPVIGDRGGLYVSEAIAEAIRDELLPLASIITPNRFELGWLSGKPVENGAEIELAAKAVGVPTVVATSAHAMMAGAIANQLVMDGHSVLAEHRALERAPNGLGDLFSALLLSRIADGLPTEEALRLAASSVFEMAVRSVEAGSDELLIETEASSMRTPMALVNMRRLLASGVQSKRVKPLVLDEDHSD